MLEETKRTLDPKKTGKDWIDFFFFFNYHFQSHFLPLLQWAFEGKHASVFSCPTGLMGKLCKPEMHCRVRREIL